MQNTHCIIELSSDLPCPFTFSSFFKLKKRFSCGEGEVWEWIIYCTIIHLHPIKMKRGATGQMRRVSPLPLCMPVKKGLMERQEARPRHEKAGKKK